MATDITMYDGVLGGSLEIGTITLDPANISANSEADETVTLSGVSEGDSIFLNPQDLDAGLILKGATVTDTDEVTVRLVNVTGSGVNGGELTYDYLLIKKD